MVNHPNRSKQQQPKLSDMTGYEPDNVMIVEREEAAAVKMRVEGYEALKALNAELLAALQTVMHNWRCGVPMDDRTPTGYMVAAAIAKAEGK